MTGLLFWFVRVIVLLFVIRLIVRGIYSVIGQRQRPAPTSGVSERSGGTLVRDPQCGTYIPDSRALVVGRGSDTHYFCSAACRDAWNAAHSGARVKA